MSTRGTVASESRRISIHLLRPFAIGLATVVLSVSPALADDLADEDIAELEILLDKQPEAAFSPLYRRVFGNVSNVAAVQKQLDAILRQKISAADLICDLTELQRQKLELAARGDIKRLLDRVDEFDGQLKRAGSDREKIDALLQETWLIKARLTTELSDDGSLLYKSLKNLLTPEQTARIGALQEIKRLGGRVQTESRGPDAVLVVSLSGVVIPDEGLARLVKLTSLQELDLTSTKISDAALVHLDGLTRLQSLDLTSTQITDAGLDHLAGLTNLQSLDLTGTKVTDAGLARLNRLKALQRLELMNTHVTSAGLAHLSELTNLTHLNLSDTPVTDQGLSHVISLPNLQWLNLHQAPVTDAGMVYLKKVANLEWLDLSRTQVSDAGLSPLGELSNLLWINLSSTQVTDTGLSRLKRELPHVNIWKRRDTGSD